MIEPKDCTPDTGTAAKAAAKAAITAAMARRLRAPAFLTLSALALSGCSGPIIGALTLGEISTIASLASSFLSGRDLGEHTLSLATGKDCRLLESVLRKGRDFCEEPGSAATENDFPGVIALLAPRDAPDTAVAGTPSQGRDIDALALGFAPIDRSLDFAEFSLEQVADTRATSKATRLSFGFMSASFGQSWSYQVTPGVKTREATGPRAAPAQASLKRDRGETRLAMIDRPAPRALPARRSDGRMIVPD